MKIKISKKNISEATTLDADELRRLAPGEPIRPRLGPPPVGSPEFKDVEKKLARQTSSAGSNFKTAIQNALSTLEDELVRVFSKHMSDIADAETKQAAAPEDKTVAGRKRE